MKTPTWAVAFLAALLVAITSSCSHSPLSSSLSKDTLRYQDFEKGFYALVEKELKANPNASKPELKIEKISESPSTLKIRYFLKYSEDFSEGEKIQRQTSGTAVLKKNYASSDEEWVLDSLEDAIHKMHFKKGSSLSTFQDAQSKEN